MGKSLFRYKVIGNSGRAHTVEGYNRNAVMFP